jgi:hypothetical protein
MKKIVLLALCVAAISAVSCKSEAEKKAEELKQQAKETAADLYDQANKTAAEYGF